MQAGSELHESTEPTCTVGSNQTIDRSRLPQRMQEPDVDVIAKLLDEGNVPTTECVATLASAVASATQELAAFREDAAARREAESRVGTKLTN